MSKSTNVTMDNSLQSFVTDEDLTALLTRWKGFAAQWSIDAGNALDYVGAERCLARESIYRVCIGDLTHLMNHRKSVSTHG